jgi:cyclic pyranopterin phosphate synthase
MSGKNSKNWAMADVSEKSVTHRIALASGKIVLGDEALTMLADKCLPKGDPLPMAEIAGILAAKQAPSLIPLCHPISLNRVAVQSVIRREEGAVEVFVTTEIAERTGVEMEALTGLQIALLTIWDLVKPVNAALKITDCRLLYKSGGKQGTWINPEGMPDEATEILETLLNSRK